MKMVVAYVDRDRFEPIRHELVELGFLSLSVLEANGSVPEATVTGTHRGVTIEEHLRPKVRVECVVGDEHAQTVIDTVLKHATEHVFVFVVAIDQAYPTGTVKGADVALQTG